MYRARIIRVLVAASCAMPAANCLAEETVSFTRDIRPILSDNCFACHGPDEQERQADLRLDIGDSALELGAIVPEDLNASEMWNRINSEDPDEVMPPPNFHKQLTDDQRAAIRTWIESGAEYEQHWSFVAPQKPQSFLTRDTATSRSTRLLRRRLRE